MILLLDPEPPFLRWCSVESDRLSTGTLKAGAEWTKNPERRPWNLSNITAIGYLLHHGGEAITSPASFVTADLLRKVETCVKYLPEHNSLTLKAAKHGLATLPTIPHVLLCDTALFVDLPAEASTYAVPFELRERGIRRYGGFGLCHEWGLAKVRPFMKPSDERVISVVLGDNTNIAAFKRGRVMETSIGFTSIEGVISAHGCGDLDPNIIFQLNSAGMTLEEINHLLSTKSGFSGLLGRKCSYLDVIEDTNDTGRLFVKQVYSYQIIKYIGGSIGVLGGADVILFMTEHPNESRALIFGICDALIFLGLKLKPSPDIREHLVSIADDSSLIKVFCVGYSKWKTMADVIQGLLS